ncbi:MAG: exosome complex protein Rrp42 [Candidatus Heimdallarchaeaceae archaeon]
MSDDYVVSEIEKDYILTLLDQGKRIGGREKQEHRPIKFELNFVETKAEGSAIVTLGETKIIAGVKATLGSPFPDTPDSGVITTSAELSPIASPYYESGPPGDDAIELARVTDRAIRESHCIDLSKLCIVPGKYVWILFIDMYVLNADGNLIDAATLASLAALSTTKIPKVKINEEGEPEVLDEKEVLELDHYPVTVTSYKIGKHRIIDPILKEERIANCRITFGFDEEGHIVSAQKGGTGVLKPDELVPIAKECLEVSKSYRAELLKAIEEFKKKGN